MSIYLRVLENFMMKKKFQRPFTIPRTLQQNGRTKRKQNSVVGMRNHTLLEMV